MRAYFDCFSGISGDMIAGALIDLGAPLDRIAEELAKLDLPGFQIDCAQVKRSFLAATKFSVRLEDADGPRAWIEVKKLLEKSRLDEDVKSKAFVIFERLAHAEAKVHGVSLEDVHFHEVGATDAIVDVISTCIALKLLGIEEVRSSPVATGSGIIRTAHGVAPIPSPAAAELLKGVPLYAGDIEDELTTPTGAAILVSLAKSYGPMPSLKVSRVGYGAGSREHDLPNVLRVFLAEAPTPAESATLIETTIDTADGELLSYAMEQLLQAGALDVWFMPVFMKKNRPGMVVCAIARTGEEETLASILLREANTLGVRVSPVSRITSEREILKVASEWGDASVKVAKYRGQIISVRPEFEDCRAISLKSGLPVVEVRRLLTDLARKRLGME